MAGTGRRSPSSYPCLSVAVPRWGLALQADPPPLSHRPKDSSGRLLCLPLWPCNLSSTANPSRQAWHTKRQLFANNHHQFPHLPAMYPQKENLSSALTSCPLFCWAFQPGKELSQVRPQTRAQSAQACGSSPAKPPGPGAPPSD